MKLLMFDVSRTISRNYTVAFLVEWTHPYPRSAVYHRFGMCLVAPAENVDPWRSGNGFLSTVDMTRTRTTYAITIESSDLCSR